MSYNNNSGRRDTLTIVRGKVQSGLNAIRTSTKSNNNNALNAACSVKLDALTPGTKAIVKKVVASVPDAVDKLQLYTNVIFAVASEIRSVKDATAYVQQATEIMQQPETKASINRMVQDLNDMLAVSADQGAFEAFAEYLSCLIQKAMVTVENTLEDKSHMNLVLSLLDLLFTTYSVIVADPRISEMIKRIGDIFKTHGTKISNAVQSEVQHGVKTNTNVGMVGGMFRRFAGGQKQKRGNNSSRRSPQSSARKNERRAQSAGMPGSPSKLRNVTRKQSNRGSPAKNTNKRKNK